MQMERPIFLSGRVLLSSGEAPTEPIRILRVCGMRTTPEGYTDSKGRFSFQVGANASLAVMDASIGGWSTPGGTAGGSSFGSLAPSGNSTREIDLSGCTLEADAPGYRSNPIILGRRRSMERSEVGTFILTPLAGTQAMVVSATSLAAPKKARSSFDKAVNELSKGPSAKADKAIRDLEKAVALYPEYAAAWAILGQTRSLAGDSEGAIEALERAVQSDSRYLRPYDTLARLTIEAGNWERTVELADFVLGVNPTNNQMRWYKAVSQFEMKSHDEAIDSLTELQSDEAGQKQFPQTHHVLGLIYADRGQFTEAASEYRRYLELAPTSPAGDGIKRQLYEWEQLGIIEKPAG
jgi:Tfp pilus assembly protein PilF